MTTASPPNEKILFKLRNYNFRNSKRDPDEIAQQIQQQPEMFMEPFVPTAVVRMELDPRILELLNSSAQFATPTEATATNYSEADFHNLGFWGPFNDGPHMPKFPAHVYYEGYFHAASPALVEKRKNANQQPLDEEGGEEDAAKEEMEKEKEAQVNPVDASIISMNPRHGYPMKKPAAPRPLRAFLFAFKKANESWLQPLFEKLNLPFLNMETAFADIAAQHHHGAEVQIEAKKRGGWHFDSPNSLLHLSISLHGERYLHFVHHQEKSASASVVAENEETDNNTKNKNNKSIEEFDEEVYSRVKNAIGGVYLASPSGFMHAVEYPQCSFNDRILAIQCRTLLDSRLDFLGQKVDWDSKTAIVGEFLREQQKNTLIRLPTFEEVCDILVEMDKAATEAEKNTLSSSSSEKKCVVQ